MGLNLDLRIGTGRVWSLQALNPDDSVPAGVFQVSDTLACTVWRGVDQAPLLAPAIAWVDASQATFAITFHDTDTLTLPRAVYAISAQATRGGDSADLLPEGSTLTLTDTPGIAVPRPVYIGVDVVRRLAPWIDDVQAPGNETGFADQLADAREWLDEAILRNYRGGNVELLGMHGLALDAWYSGGARRSSLRNPFILNLLAQGPAAANASGGLIVTGRTRDLLAHYTLHRICEGMITRGAQYPALSARSLARAHQLLASYTAEISVAGAVDYAGSLLAQIPVNFSTTNTLWA